ncbi:MAG: tetraacyldisaccharide 4'-kinase [Legionellaceae bacterium]|nr:tetraacyldisaccharide 4'-kinase [Legionellaceae bacterium]
MHKSKQFFVKIIDSLWYRKNPLRWLLWPFSIIYQFVAFSRGMYLQKFQHSQFPVPVIVVGNISVGGVGKTPVVMAIAKELMNRGLLVGIVSRGYGSKIKKFPHEVSADDTPALVGDEPFLLSSRLGCKVVISPNRSEAVQYLLDNGNVSVVISDDGLQHHAMGRTLEIAVVDGSRVFGNGLCLPAGPLRENPRRLKKVDFVISNGALIKNIDNSYPIYQMDLVPSDPINITSGKSVSWDSINSPIAAVAGIGNPERFFTTLKTLDISFQTYKFPDHYLFQKKDFINIEKNVVMTEKDAVKCKSFATESMYYLPVDAILSDAFWDSLLNKLDIRRN